MDYLHFFFTRLIFWGHENEHESKKKSSKKHAGPKSSASTKVGPKKSATAKPVAKGAASAAKHKKPIFDSESDLDDSMIYSVSKLREKEEKSEKSRRKEEKAGFYFPIISPIFPPGREIDRIQICNLKS